MGTEKASSRRTGLPSVILTVLSLILMQIIASRHALKLYDYIENVY